MNLLTPISRNVISFMGFAFVDDADLIAGAEDVNTSGATMIARFQAMMTCWNDGIRAICGLIAPEKTRWFLLSFFFGTGRIGNTTQKILCSVISFSLIKMVTSIL